MCILYQGGQALTEKVGELEQEKVAGVYWQFQGTLRVFPLACLAEGIGR